jgi:hypothetical protein
MAGGDNKKRGDKPKIVPWPTVRGGNWPHHRRCFICGQRDELRATLDGTRYYCPTCDEERESTITDHKTHKKASEDVLTKYLEWCKECMEEWIDWFAQKWYKF